MQFEGPRRAPIRLLGVLATILLAVSCPAQAQSPPSTNQPAAPAESPASSVDSASSAKSAQGAQSAGEDAAPPTTEEVTAAATEPPARAELQQRLETVQDDTELADEAKQAIVNHYEQAIKAMAQREADQTLTTKLEMAEATADQRLAELKQSTDKPLNLQLESFKSETEFDKLTSLKRETDSLLNSATERLSTTQTTQRTRTEELKLLPQQISTLRDTIDELQSAATVAPDAATPALADAMRVDNQAQLAASRAALELALQKQKTYEAESPLLELRISDTQRTIDALQQRLTSLTNAISTKQAELAEEEIAKLEASLKPARLASLPLTEKFLAVVNAWPEMIRQSKTWSNKLMQERELERQLRKDFSDTRSQVDSDLNVGRGLSRGMSLLLQGERAKLPDIKSLNDAQGKLADQIEATFEDRAKIEDLIERLSREQTIPAETREQMLDLLNRYKKDANQLWNETLKPLTDVYNERIKTTEEFSEFIQKHLLWVRSQKPLSPSDYQSAKEGFLRVFDKQNIARLIEVSKAEVRQRLPVVLAWLLATILMFGSRGWFLKRIAEQADEVQKRGGMRMAPTFEAMLATVMLSLPFALAFGIPGQLLRHANSSESLVIALAEALRMLSVLFLPLEFLRQFLRPRGVADAHFKWPSSATGPMRRTVLRMELLVLPLLFIWRLMHAWPENASACRWINIRLNFNSGR